MRLRTFFSGEPSLTQEILKGLRDPMWSTLMSTTHSHDNYDVKITDDRAVYQMIIAGRSEDEIDIDIINDYLVVKAKKAGWIPAQEFQFGLPTRRDSIEARLVDGVLTVEVAIAKSASKSGKIVINKSEK
jgi:HSP20 family molecular chaperone IbpA